MSCCLMLVSFPGVLGILASRMVISSGEFVRQPSSSSSFCAFRAKMSCSVLFCVAKMLTV